MDTNEIIQGIDAEIARLEKARTLLAGSTTKTAIAKRRGLGGMSGAGGKRTMSAAGRARIAAAQKARWAKAKRAK